MRRSKIQRQEERRSRTRQTRRAAKETSGGHEGWTVVHEDDVTEMKYPCRWKPEWFEEARARDLAKPAHPTHKWVAVSVADLAAFGGPGITYSELVARKKAAPVADEDL